MTEQDKNQVAGDHDDPRLFAVIDSQSTTTHLDDETDHENDTRGPWVW